MRRLYEIEDTLPSVDSLKLPTRVVRLPMAFQDSATLAAVARYAETVRSTAPWLPSNAEFVQRINGLGSVQEVRDIIFSARYIVLGLGDVYLGAAMRCCRRSAPSSPQLEIQSRAHVHRGGNGRHWRHVYVHYGMDSPGGYQLMGARFQSGISSSKTLSSRPMNRGCSNSSIK